MRRLTFSNNQVTKGKIHEIKPTDNGNGYLIVGLNFGGKRKNYYVHRLVAEAFCYKPQGCDVVNHIDYNKCNNTAKNLEWCTQKSNILHSAVRMSHEKNKCKETNTGHKYIWKTKYNTYRLSISRLKVYKTFKEIDKAIEYRNEVVKNGGL